MDTKQKQRIIGIIFLVILAVVAIPAFLKRTGNSAQPAPTLDAVSPTSDDTLNQQGSPSALPAEPMGQEQNQMHSQPAPAVPGDQMNPPSISQPSTAQQPIPNQPLPTNPPPATSQQPAFNSGESAQEPMPTSEGMPATLSQEPSAEEAPLPAHPSAEQPKKTEIKKQPAKSMASSAKKSLGVKVHKQEAHAEKSNWTIRLAIFSVRVNAEKLVQNLKKQGYKASIEEINTYKGMAYKVTLPAQGSRADADKLAAKLNTQFHISVIVNRSV